MQCSIVIRAYNEAKHLGRLLEGITRQTYKDADVTLVDSGSTDATVRVAESHGARVVHIAPQEFTFGRSLNLGIHAALADIVVIASAHVFPVYPDWIKTLLRPFEDPSTALVYGKQRGAAGSKFSEQRIFRQWFPDTDIADQASPFCNNANAAIRRRLWEQHPYDETLTGLEDVEWAKWAQARGGRVAYAAHAEVTHIHQETARGVYNRYRREAMAFKRIFPESHFSIYDFLRLTTSNVRNDAAQALREAAFWRNVAEIAWFRGAQFWGTYQGYRHSSAVTQELRQRFYYPAGSGANDAAESSIQPIRYNEATAGRDSTDESSDQGRIDTGSLRHSEGAMQSRTIVFIHGMFMTPLCWENWIARYESRGYKCLAPAWPGRDQAIESQRSRHPDAELGRLDLKAVVDGMDAAIRPLQAKPVLIGHSMGGLVVQLLLQRGLGAAGVAIHPAAPQGVFTTAWSYVKSNLPAINPLAPAGLPVVMSFPHFQYAFVNTLPLDQQRAAYDRYVVPESRRVPRQSLTSAAHVDFKKPHAPLLITAGEEDHIIPASLNRTNYERYRVGDSVTEFKPFAGRDHFVIGEPGWQEVADFILSWVETKVDG